MIQIARSARWDRRSRPLNQTLGIKMNMSRISPLFLMLLSSSPPANASDSNWLNESAQATLSISKQSDNISFSYVNEGTYRCEISGIAKPTETGRRNVYIFKNQPEYWQGKGSEENGFPEVNGDCTVSFNFSDSSVIIKSGGNCKSFCGLGGDIDATLTKVEY